MLSGLANISPLMRHAQVCYRIAFLSYLGRRWQELDKVLISTFVLAFTFATTDPITEYRESCVTAQLKRFPPPEIVKVQLEFSSSHTTWLEENKNIILRTCTGVG